MGDSEAQWGWSVWEDTDDVDDTEGIVGKQPDGFTGFEGAGVAWEAATSSTKQPGVLCNPAPWQLPANTPGGKRTMGWCSSAAVGSPGMISMLPYPARAARQAHPGDILVRSSVQGHTTPHPSLEHAHDGDHRRGHTRSPDAPTAKHCTAMWAEYCNAPPAPFYAGPFSSSSSC